MWKVKTNHDIDTTFPSCNLNIPKSTKHRFWHCLGLYNFGICFHKL
jgi:hypothetical protein